MQAADFLGDKEGVQALCTEAAQLIYSTPTECIPTKGRPKKTRKSAQKESAKRTSPECPGEITQETSAVRLLQTKTILVHNSAVQFGNVAAGCICIVPAHLTRISVSYVSLCAV